VNPIVGDKQSRGIVMKKIGDFCEVSTGGTPQTTQKQYYENGTVNWLKSGDVKGDRIGIFPHKITELGLKNSNARIHPRNTVMLAMSGQGKTRGTSAILAEPSACSQSVAAILPSSHLKPEYIHFWLKLKYEDIRWLTGNNERTGLNLKLVRNIELPFLPIEEQNRIVEIVERNMAWINTAVRNAEAQLEAAKALPAAYVRESLNIGKLKKYLLSECLSEIKTGVGSDWIKYPVLGATRSGLAPAKDPVGKKPERYKLVDHETVFYNPMRILLGSIAMVDRCDEPGITSPDYVVVKGIPGVLDTRWFYYFFRSSMGERLIKTLVRGAVRERILFKRLAKGEIELPSWEVQRKMSDLMFKARDLTQPIQGRIDELNLLPSKYLKMVFCGEL
jgi:type I restriction enzyme S subunit